MAVRSNPAHAAPKPAEPGWWTRPARARSRGPKLAAMALLSRSGPHRWPGRADRRSVVCNPTQTARTPGSTSVRVRLAGGRPRASDVGEVLATIAHIPNCDARAFPQHASDGEACGSGLGQRLAQAEVIAARVADCGVTDAVGLVDGLLEDLGAGRAQRLEDLVQVVYLQEDRQVALGDNLAHRVPVDGGNVMVDGG